MTTKRVRYNLPERTLQEALDEQGVKKDPHCSICKGTGVIVLGSGDIDFCFQCNDAIVNSHRLQK